MEKKCEKCKHFNCEADKYPCSECDSNVNDLFEEKKQTNADRIRLEIATDEGLADFINKLDPDADRVHYCGNDDKCIDLMDKGEGPTKEMCRQCLLNWLRSEAKEE